MMKKNAVTYEITGRLGNQLQLYACARILSLRYGWDFIYRPLIHEEELQLPFKRRKKIELFTRHIFHKKVVLDNHDWDTSFNVNGRMEEKFLEKKNTLFILKWGGIFKDLREYREKLIKEIFPPQLLEKGPFPPENHIAVHIRRDDTNYPLPLSYYVKAFRKAGSPPDQQAELHLFSDGDHNRICEELEQELPGTEIIIHQGTAIEDLTTMSKFRKIIISASWFSYWAAFLSNNSKIYAPENFCYYREWEAITMGDDQKSSKKD